MLRTSLVIGILLAGVSGFLQTPGLSTAAAAACETTATVEEIAAGSFVRHGQPGEMFVDANLANAGFIVGTECVAVIDTGGSPAEGRALDCAIKQITETPVCYAVVTHHHYDHSSGSSVFKQNGAEIVGHAKLGRSMANNAGYYAEQLTAGGMQVDAKEWVGPDRAVEIGAPLELDLGGHTLRIEAHPPAHTDNDLSVYDQQTETLWLGDLLFVEHIPALEATSKGWLEVMTELTKQSAQRAVPGHGPATTPWPDSGKNLQLYLTTVREEVAVLLEEGGDLTEALEKVGQGERDKWQQFDEFHKRNVSKIFTEMEWE